MIMSSLLLISCFVLIVMQLKSKILYFQEIFQNRVIRLREAEFERQKSLKEEHLQARKQERDVKRKRIYYSKCEEERIRKLQEEEEARKQRGKQTFVVMNMQ